MKRYFASISTLAISALVTLPVTIAAISAPAHAEQAIAQVAFEPVGRIDPNLPIQIQVINEGANPVTCQLTQPASAQRQLNPGGSTTFGTTNANFLSLPLYLLVSPNQTDISLVFSVSTSGNQVTLTVREVPGDAPGEDTLNIATNGGIFIY